MKPADNLNEIHDRIQSMKKAAKDLETLSTDIPALSKNVARILTSLKMLELNFSDALDLESEP